MNWYDEARSRAGRRRSPWNLLLIPATVVPLGLLWWGFAALLELVHGTLYSAQGFSSTPRGVGPILAAVAPVFAAAPLSMLIGNTLVQWIRPARRALEGEAAHVPRTDFSTVQHQLLRAGLVLVPIGFGLAVLGALLPWKP